MRNRVYGVVGVVNINSIFNADFNGRPRLLPDGETYYASDKSFKYATRFYLDMQGFNVFNFRRNMLRQTLNKKNKEVEKVELVPRTLKESYEHLFNVEDLSKVTNASKILKNLFTCSDVRQFGTTFAETGKYFGIRGAVQVYQGINLYEDSNEAYQQIISPYRNSSDKGDNALATTIGLNIFLDEAHYVFPFTVNPLEYDKWIEKGVTKGYVEADYELLKECFTKGVTALTSCSKVGCENEYAIFIKIKEGVNLYLPNLSRMMRFEKRKNKEDKDKVMLDFGELLTSLGDKIEDVEVYYDKYNLDIVFNYDKVKYIDIFTDKEIK